MNNQSRKNAKGAASNASNKQQRPKPKPVASIMKANLPKRDKLARDVLAGTSISQTQTTGSATILSTKNGRIIAHSELLGTVNGSVAFSALRYPINPGMAVTFPWLAPQAALYEQYRFRKLQFRFVTRTATTTLGSVMLVPEYDASDPTPPTEASASASEGAVEDRCYVNLTCKMDPRAMEQGSSGGRKFIRAFAQAGDIKTFDAGAFFFCAMEQIGTSAIGKLWVDYEVELHKPQLGGISTINPTGTSEFALLGTEALVTAVAKNFIPNVSVIDPLAVGIVGTPLTNGTFTPPAGAYRVACNVNIRDDTAETLTATLTLFKNGVALVPSISAKQNAAAVAADGEFISLSIDGIVTCSGTDTVALSVTATGAAGVLTVIDASHMLWSLA